ncbi:MAG: RsmD family RNA methyltransferase [Deltaproteobacteria bacterium]|nr:RsmD family RNA methyltransferase [Deltaproteobacteria bacterium]
MTRLEGAGSGCGVSCSHLERCGACTAMAQPYEQQLEAKQQRVQAAVDTYPLLQGAQTQAPRPANPAKGYRTRAKLVVGEGGAIGLYAKDTAHEVVDIPGCQVLSPAILQATQALRERLAAGRLALTPGLVLLAVDLREVQADAEPRVLLTLVLRRDLAPPRDHLVVIAKELLRDVPIVCGVACSLRDVDSPRVLGQEMMHLAGEASVRDRMGRAYHYATFGTFAQVHRGQAARMHDLLAEQIQGELGAIEPVRVLELYGGSGSIGLDLAHAGARVDMVESFGPAAQAAAKASEEQALASRFRVCCGDAFAAGRQFVVTPGTYDVVVVNPPRRGLACEVRELIARAAPRGVAYVSCDPDTLARDLDHLRRLGYAPSRLVPFDMIPQTEEVETFAWLKPEPVPAPAVLYEDEEIVAVDKAPHEPTTPQAEHMSSLLARVRTLEGTSGCVPVRRLDVGGSGVCLVAKSAGHAARWADAMNDPSARVIFVVGCRGITPGKGSITRELREQGRMVQARTRYRRLAVFAGHSILRVVPEQAHPHQIRRHLAAIGHPVLGDQRYGHGPTNRFFEEKHGLDRTFQHCVRLELTHPTTGYRLVIESSLAPDLRTTLHRSGGSPTLLFLAHKHALGTRGYSSIPPAPDKGRDSFVPADAGQSVPPSSREDQDDPQ